PVVDVPPDRTVGHGKLFQYGKELRKRQRRTAELLGHHQLERARLKQPVHDVVGQARQPFDFGASLLQFGCFRPDDGKQLAQSDRPPKRVLDSRPKRAGVILRPTKKAVTLVRGSRPDMGANHIRMLCGQVAATLTGGEPGTYSTQGPPRVRCRPAASLRWDYPHQVQGIQTCQACPQPPSDSSPRVLFLCGFATTLQLAPDVCQGRAPGRVRRYPARSRWRPRHGEPRGRVEPPSGIPPAFVLA